ncbi:MAG: hypothetical protein ACE5EN_10300 [Nitrospinota bacterium]
MRFGEYLVSKKLVKEEEVSSALEAQRQSKPLIGSLAVGMGYMTKMDNLKILMIQNKTEERYGDIAVAKNYLTRDQVEELFRIRESETTPLGKMLVMQGSISREKLILAFMEFSRLQDE